MTIQQDSIMQYDGLQATLKTVKELETAMCG